MTVYKEQISVESHGNTPTYINITPQVREAIAKSGIKNGTCSVISPHTTCAVFFEEFVHDYTEDGDEYLQAALNDVLEKIIPNQVSWDQYRYPGEKHFEAVENGQTSSPTSRAVTGLPSGTATPTLKLL